MCDKYQDSNGKLLSQVNWKLVDKVSNQVFDPGIHFSSVLTTTPRKSSFSVFDRIAEILLTVVAVVGVQVQVVILMENLIFDPGIFCSFRKEKKLTVHICY